ncbi:MAG TPA: hypothetical protein VK154_01475 [Chitinophagales bacterium]|nr:hypothetical protein [Chitinophagales bacterium]
MNMKKWMGVCLVFCVLLCTIDSKAQDASLKEVLNEFIDSLAKNDYTQIVYYLQGNGTAADVISSYKTTSFNRPTVTFAMPVVGLKYLFPQPDTVYNNYADSLVHYRFPTGGYTSIQTKNLESFITRKGDTIIYKTPERKLKNGHYGIYLNDKNGSGYKQFSYAWFIPENFEILYYKCNRPGTWRKEGNMIHFIAKPNQNDILFEIAYKTTVKIPEVINGRKVNYTKTFDIASPDITIKASDPQRADGDIISLNLNGSWILKGYEVSERALALKTSAIRGQNYLVLYAENMGSIPPNTAALEIWDGVTSHKIILNSATGYCEAILLNLK